MYVDQPPGYEVGGAEHKVYRLHKALYGLKQAPPAWYNKIKAYFVNEGFKKCPYEHTLLDVFIKHTSTNKILLVCLYVDDLIFTGNDDSLFNSFKCSMMQEFDMTNLGKMRYFLGLEVVQQDNGIFLCQQKYACEILEIFHMTDCNSVHNPIVPGSKLMKDPIGEHVDSTLYKQLVGSLMYLTSTRPDLMFVVSLLKSLHGTHYHTTSPSC